MAQLYSLPDVKLTDVSYGFDATLNVSLLQGVEPGAVVEFASRLQQINES